MVIPRSPGTSHRAAMTGSYPVTDADKDGNNRRADPWYERFKLGQNRAGYGPYVAKTCLMHI